MTVRLYGAVKDQGLVTPAEFGRRLDELAFCRRVLGFTTNDFRAGAEDDAARRLALLATRRGTDRASRPGDGGSGSPATERAALQKSLSPALSGRRLAGKGARP